MTVEKNHKEVSTEIALLSLVTVILTGLNGLIAFIFLMVFSRVNFGKDPIIKHGIASGASRLGGLAIIISVLVGVISNLFLFDTLTINSFNAQFDNIVYYSILIGLIGMGEDFSQSFKPNIRLIAMLFLVGLSLIAMPQLTPLNLEVFNSIGIEHNPYIIIFFTLIMVCGFINAGNIADGANGLLASVYVSFFLILYSLDSSIFNFSILMSLIAFIIYNVTTGRIFLGDFGSYSLSALVAFKSLEVYANHDLAIFLLASILIYPCFELIRSIIVRLFTRASLMSPDNHHFHNYINDYLLSFGFTRHVTNSMTGLGLALITSGPPLTLFFSDQDTSGHFWLYCFVLQIISLLFIYLYCLKKSSR